MSMKVVLKIKLFLQRHIISERLSRTWQFFSLQKSYFFPRAMRILIRERFSE
jgi:hypothetical protein